MTIPRLNEVDFEQGGIFVPDEEKKDLNMLVRDASCVEKLATHVPMTRLVLNMRRQSDGVEGYWVDAMEVKPKDKPYFERYTLTAEKLAVIIPLEDQLVEDADDAIAAVIRQDVVGAFGEMLDRTYMGYEPTTPFAQSLSVSTPAANTIAYGAAGDDLAGDISLMMQALEVNGFELSAMIAHPSVKHVLRDLRDLQNQPIFAENLRGEVTTYTVFGVPICFTRQVQQAGSPLASEILGFYKPYVKIGDRSDLDVSMSNEATLTQGTETPINLWEMDMHAYRFVMRRGFVVKDEDALTKITNVPMVP